MEAEIRCPQCNSNQLHVDKKGFSAGKAIGGAILAGGVGALAGFHGKGNIVITCLACGKKFKAGEGNTSSPTNGENENFIDVRIKEILTTKGMLPAVKYHKSITSSDLAYSKRYVEDLARKEGITPKKEGCFIATACYNSYDAEEVLILRNFRDRYLNNTILGRLFVKCYYATSPTFVKFMSDSERIKHIIKYKLLNPLVEKLKDKYQ